MRFAGDSGGKVSAASGRTLLESKPRIDVAGGPEEVTTQNEAGNRAQLNGACSRLATTVVVSK